jgi:hypothetical protein
MVIKMLNNGFFAAYWSANRRVVIVRSSRNEASRALLALGRCGMITVKLVGGPYDGEILKIDERREIIYLPKKITFAESALKIDENTAWMPHEHVYVRQNETTYFFRE